MDSHRYGVRVGEDGRWHLKTCSWALARAYAVRLSNAGVGRAQIVDFREGHSGRDTYEWGECIRKGIDRKAVR